MRFKIVLLTLAAVLLVGCGSTQKEPETESNSIAAPETETDAETESYIPPHTESTTGGAAVESTTDSEIESDTVEESEPEMKEPTEVVSESEDSTEVVARPEPEEPTEVVTKPESEEPTEVVTKPEPEEPTEVVTKPEPETEETSEAAPGTNTEQETESTTESNTEESTEDVEVPVMRDITTMELVQEMGVGINLGNTYESFGDWLEQWGDGSVESYETAWGSPVITQKIIQGYANEGFGVLRIPVHWMNLMEEDYTLSPAYIDAVKEVVDWALEADMYVIINIHHDEDGFFADFPTDTQRCMAAYVRVWEQIAEAFKGYGDHLLFEALNEEGGWDSLWNRWGGTTGKKEAYELLNDINQAFVDTVRESGGNNEVRHLLISGYFTDIELTCDPLFQMPQDPAGNCAVTVHYYTPSTFTILEEDADWGTCRTTWGTDADYAELERLMNLMQNTFVKKDIPVIIGEYGCTKKNKEEASVRRYITSVCEEALKRDICPIMWDVTNLHYNRTTCQMVDQELKQQLADITATYCKN